MPADDHRNARPALALVTLLSLALLASGCGDDDGSTSAAAGSAAAGSAAAAAARAQERIGRFGSVASPSQAESAEAVLHGYLDARAAGEWNRACSYQARVVRRLLNRIDDRGTGTKGRGCAGFLAASTEELSDSELAELADADVSSVRVEGERGYVLYEDGAGAERALAIKLEAGKWRVLGISGPSLTDRAAARDGDS